MIIDFFMMLAVNFLGVVYFLTPKFDIPTEWLSAVIVLKEVVASLDTYFPFSWLLITFGIVISCEITVLICRSIIGVANWLRGAEGLKFR